MESVEEPVYRNNLIQMYGSKERNIEKGFYSVDEDKVEKVIKILRTSGETDEFYRRVGHMIELSILRRVDSTKGKSLSFRQNVNAGNRVWFGHYKSD